MIMILGQKTSITKKKIFMFPIKDFGGNIHLTELTIESVQTKKFHYLS